MLSALPGLLCHISVLHAQCCLPATLSVASCCLFSVATSAFSFSFTSSSSLARSLQVQHGQSWNYENVCTQKDSPDWNANDIWYQLKIQGFRFLRHFLESRNIFSPINITAISVFFSYCEMVKITGQSFQTKNLWREHWYATLWRQKKKAEGMNLRKDGDTWTLIACKKNLQQQALSNVSQQCRFQPNGPGENTLRIALLEGVDWLQSGQYSLESYFTSQGQTDREPAATTPWQIIQKKRRDVTLPAE